MKISHKIFGYVLVFILCWTVEWIIWITGLILNTKLPYPVIVLYASLPHAQGFLNAIVYGLSINSIHVHYTKQPWIVVLFKFFLSPILLWIWTLPRWLWRKNAPELETSEQLIQNAR